MTLLSAIATALLLAFGAEVQLPAIATESLAAAVSTPATEGANGQAATGAMATPADGATTGTDLPRTGSPSDVIIPELAWMPANDVERAWHELLSRGDLANQQWALRHSTLRRAACPDLVDLRSTVAAPLFAWRDQYRGRSQVRPALARLFLRAVGQFHSEHPEAIVSLGDLAQPGCGQIAYGTLVRMAVDLPGQPGQASALLTKAQPLLGAPAVIENHIGSDYPLEKDRFHSGQEHVRAEQYLVGHGVDAQGGQVVRLATRRYELMPPAKKPKAQKRAMARLWKDVHKVWDAGQLVRSERVWTTLDDGSVAQRWVVQRVDTRRGRQILAVAAERPQGLNPNTLDELHYARWEAHKPDSFRGELRLVAHRQEDAVVWQRWRILIEADHLSHMTGRDADIAFVMKDNRKLHKVAPRELDAPATWRLLELMASAGDALGTPVEKILVGPRMRKMLLHKLGKTIRETELWRDIIVLAKGHDDHFHLRLKEPPAEADRAALLDLRDAGHAPQTVGLAPRAALLQVPAP